MKSETDGRIKGRGIQKGPHGLGCEREAKMWLKNSLRREKGRADSARSAHLSAEWSSECVAKVNVSEAGTADAQQAANPKAAAGCTQSRDFVVVEIQHGKRKKSAEHSLFTHMPRSANQTSPAEGSVFTQRLRPRLRLLV